ncbi:hypothetical protein [Saliphagus sp. LR7]|uniref:hypothetical protein n=1 Tax=Saliphagus sp. LR7 TaxID=2282654 RepID=UPI000DF79BAB|nr:hypothetical protein [Saliphagus sp. LR7]
MTTIDTMNEKDPFANQTNNGLYVGTTDDGDRLYVDPFAENGKDRFQNLLTVGISQTGKTYAVKQAAAEWVAGGEERLLIVVEPFEAFASIIEWFDGERYKRSDNLPETPSGLDHTHLTLEPTWSQDKISDVVFDYLQAKVDSNGSADTLVVINEVHSLFQATSRFRNLLDRWTGSNTSVWAITRHVHDLIGVPTPPPDRTLAVKFGTRQCFHSTLTHQKEKHGIDWWFGGAHRETIRSLDPQQCLVLGQLKRAKSRETKLSSPQSPQEGSIEKTEIETAPEPAHSILEYDSHRDGEFVNYLNSIDEGWS